MTYRDMETYRNIVQAAPLYPAQFADDQGFAHARYGTAAEVGSNSGRNPARTAVLLRERHLPARALCHAGE